MRDFRTLKFWVKAHALTLSVYKATASFPREELFGLTSQMRRSAASIPTNIAEGCGANSDPEFARFCQIAVRSSCELEYQLLLSRDLGYLSQPSHAELESSVIEVRRMLIAFLQKLRPSDPGPG
ncbi:MAG TPA: four helix bundle protein [Fimbriiglobus sp.]|nr:four helix bundle protein [Fimbriiglobus sp.]